MRMKNVAFRIQHRPTVSFNPETTNHDGVNYPILVSQTQEGMGILHVTIEHGFSIVEVGMMYKKKGERQGVRCFIVAIPS
jgi:hypothetical protein